MWSPTSPASPPQAPSYVFCARGFLEPAQSLHRRPEPKDLWLQALISPITAYKAPYAQFSLQRRPVAFISLSKGYVPQVVQDTGSPSYHSHRELGCLTARDDKVILGSCFLLSVEITASGPRGVPHSHPGTCQALRRTGQMAWTDDCVVPASSDGLGSTGQVTARACLLQKDTQNLPVQAQE